jgi:hypothetical protein
MGRCSQRQRASPPRRAVVEAAPVLDFDQDRPSALEQQIWPAFRRSHQQVRQAPEAQRKRQLAVLSQRLGLDVAEQLFDPKPDHAVAALLQERRQGRLGELRLEHILEGQWQGNLPGGQRLYPQLTQIRPRNVQLPAKQRAGPVRRSSRRWRLPS